MLRITDIQELREKVAGKEEIRENKIGEDLTAFCYMISAENTFDNPWARECRGIVFDRFGKVCSRPLHKFFNVNEREETLVHNLDWSNVVRVMDKRDGSMIHTVKIRERSHPGIAVAHSVQLKSKKSFESDVARAAVNWVADTTPYGVARKFPPSVVEQKEIGRFIKKVAVDYDATIIFEWTAPDARIVLSYTEPELRLLHIRDNEDGNYWSVATLKEIAAEYNIKMVDETNEFWGATFSPEDGRYLKIAEMLEAAKTRENIEGWVIQFRDGEMVKLKTEWYLKRHKAMTFLRERDIADLVLSEGLDDLKALLVGDGVDITQILEIEKRVLDDIRNIERRVNVIVTPDSDYDLPRKDFVMKYREPAGELFSMLMKMYDDQLPPCKEFFEKNMFKQNYGLKQLTLIPSVAEAE